MTRLGLFCLFFVFGCRQDVIVSGNTTHTGQIETVLVFKIDVTACDGLPTSAQVECVHSLIDTFNNLANIANTLKSQKGAANEVLSK